MAEIDQAQLKAVVLKLLDKAGLDPRLTPRILRNKVEDKMSITRGGLKVKREYIKTLIFKWWKVNNPESTITSGPLPSIKATLSSSSSSAEKAKIEPTEDDKEWKALIRVAKAGDKWPLLGKGLGALEVKEKKSELRKRLRGCGFVFSQIPTDSEVEKVRKDTDMRKDVEGIDSTLIMSPSKKRRTEGEVPTKPTVSNAHKSSTSTAPALATKSTSSTGKSPTNASASVSSTVAKPSSSSDGVTKPKKFIQYNSSDEEGDF